MPNENELNDLGTDVGNESLETLQDQISQFEESYEGSNVKVENLGAEAVDGYVMPEVGGLESALEVTDGILLDAWYASYDDNPPDPALEVVIGDDDRKRIRNTTSFPWRAICSLIMTTKTGKRYIGTGWMISPRTLVTAGHCVYMHNEGGWAESIEVIPGRDARNRPYGSCVARSLRSVKGWTEGKKTNFDYGAIILPENCRYGSQVGYFGFARLSDNSTRNKFLNVSGYPGDMPSGTHWYHGRKTQAVNDHKITYQIDTAGGQSGAPVWYRSSGSRYAVGIHTNGHSSGNLATRINKSVFNNMKRWKSLGM